ncbi:MAG: response regulator [Deltaproteobacteria bacterium]|nr:response regulator [Deltaproteobacteria bacterium]
MDGIKNLDLKAIRRQAEELAAQRPLPAALQDEKHQQALIHELNVHQIELEIQNDELRVIQQALEKSHNRFADLFNNAPVGYLILDRSNLIRRANQTFIDMLEIRADALFDKSFADYLSPASRQIFFGQYKAFFKQPQRKRLDLELCRPNGSSLHVAVFGNRDFSLTTATGSHADIQDHIRIAVIDISEQRRAEKALAASYRELDLRHRVAEILLNHNDEAMFAAVLTLLREFFAAENGFFGCLNQAGNLCFPAGSGMSCTPEATPDQEPGLTPENWEGLWGESLKSGQALFTNVCPAPAGVAAPLRNALAAPIMHQGEIIGQLFLANAADGFSETETRLLQRVCQEIAPVLSARRERDRHEAQRLKAEEQLRQAQRMESIGVLAGGIAHDFNNILTPIIGYSEILLEGLDPGTKAYQDIEQISASAHRARDLVAQLLAFSRKQMLNLEAIDLNRSINHLGKMLSRLIREDICLEFALNENTGLIKADSSRIDQILINLAVNAQDAMPRGGRLLIATEQCRFNGDEEGFPEDFSPGPYAVIRVSDNGCGIPERILPNIFEPFFTTKAKGQGTGMGLASCYGIIKQHNGHIWVSSREGRGSVFTVIFPAYEPEQKKQSPSLRPQREKPRLAHGETILLVEDDKHVRDMTSLILDSLGYHVLEADSPATCLELLAQGGIDYDLLLSDVIMPGMNGRELYERLRHDKPGLQCLFMSGYTDEIISDQAGLSDPVDFIGKPFTISALSRKLRELFERRSEDQV